MMKLIVCLLMLMSSLMVDSANGQLPDANLQSRPLDETSILKMGRQFGNPLLRLLGTAMKNSKMDVLRKVCSLYRCGEWSEWSPCPVENKGQFGMTTRSRECGKGPSFCKSNPSQIISTEVDSRVCMGKNCPAGFTKTDNGFCFFLHTSKMTRDDADKFCEEKSGFIVDPTTKLKSSDLRNFQKANGIRSDTIWLNARRKDINSPWEYSYGMGPGNYSNWKLAEPSNSLNELCMIEEDSVRKWFDRDCSSKYRVLCEFV